MSEAVLAVAPGFDPLRPSSARMFDYFLSGKDNYAADRALAERVSQVAPGIRALADANRNFLAQAVRTLAGEAGIRQFLDIGCGLPTAENVHEIAGKAAPGSRVVYVDNDPMVVAHALALLANGGDVDAFRADLRTPETILDNPRLTAVIDLDRPVAVLLTAVLHHLSDDEDPYGAVARIRDALPPGSHLVISHAERTSALLRAALLHSAADTPLVPRSHDRIARFFDGMELLPPGLVRIPPPGQETAGAARGGLGAGAPIPLLGGIARVTR